MYVNQSSRDEKVWTDRMKEPRLHPVQKVVRLLNERFGNEIQNIFGIRTAALTANEAN